MTERTRIPLRVRQVTTKRLAYGLGFAIGVLVTLPLTPLIFAREWLRP